ncbi:iron permease [Mycena polygramma]|nr:iron permease [Mycena polygramma]
MATSASPSAAHKDLDILPLAKFPDKKPPRDFRFWLIFLCLCVCSFLAALEIGSITTALPTIINELRGTQFIWVGSAFTLGSTALIPLAGGLAQIFGRRPVLLSSLVLFAVGSAVCGAAKEMNMLIAGRTIQGLGGGGIISLTQIIVADLVSLRERGSFNGLISMQALNGMIDRAYALGVGIGPIVGGGLTSIGQWRWLFYLNIPICGLAAILVILFLRLRTPPGTLREKFARVDYLGNMLVVAATTSTIIGLTWGGIQFPWGSAHVLVPLILGILGLGGFLVYEGRYAEYPMVPFSLLSTRTGLSGYVQTFLASMIVVEINYYIQVYFQACYNVSPLGSGVDGLALAIIAAPAGLIAGVVIQKTNSYRASIAVGWIFMIIGMGLLSTLDFDSSRSKAIGYSAISSAGLGILILATYFPVLAPITVTETAQALALFIFMRNFSLVWGITVGGTILQNELHKRLPADFVAEFPGGVEIAYSIIPVIRILPEPLKTQVRVAFADSLKVVWWTTTGIAGLGLLVCLCMKHYKLHTTVDENWGMEGEKERMEVSL